MQVQFSINRPAGSLLLSTKPLSLTLAVGSELCSCSISDQSTLLHVRPALQPRASLRAYYVIALARSAHSSPLVAFLRSRLKDLCL